MNTLLDEPIHNRKMGKFIGQTHGRVAAAKLALQSCPQAIGYRIPYEDGLPVIKELARVVESVKGLMIIFGHRVDPKPEGAEPWPEILAKLWD